MAQLHMARFVVRLYSVQVTDLKAIVDNTTQRI